MFIDDSGHKLCKMVNNLITENEKSKQTKLEESIDNHHFKVRLNKVMS